MMMRQGCPSSCAGHLIECYLSGVKEVVEDRRAGSNAAAEAWTCKILFDGTENWTGDAKIGWASNLVLELRLGVENPINAAESHDLRPD
ncbi:MAG TPA: hypothetical protein VMF06_17105 [Candidatus Limnocylindria bacterium]|jgi:hypothetical protein|nr:hypothetical protein [Candidatus Limnocylindria bacterium]